jgi:hypothetical protein
MKEEQKEYEHVRGGHTGENCNTPPIPDLAKMVVFVEPNDIVVFVEPSDV